MKKILFFGLALTAFTFVSCKKNFDCNCTYTNVDPGIDGEKHIDLDGVKESVAQDYCDAEEAELMAFGYDTYECILTAE